MAVWDVTTVLSVLLVLLLRQAAPASGQGNSTIIETRCQVPSVLQGENSSISCDFGMDVSRKGRWSALSVQREPFSGLQAEDVLDCWWTEGDAPDCDVKRGYSYDDRLGRTVVVTILKASPNHTGRFSCQLIGVNLSVDPHGCDFVLKGPSTPEPSVHPDPTTRQSQDPSTPVIPLPHTSVRPDPQTSIRTDPHMSVGPDPHTSVLPEPVRATTSSAGAGGNATVETDDEQEDDNNVGIIAGLVIVCIVVVIVVVVVVMKVVVPWNRNRQEQNTTLDLLLDRSAVGVSDRDVETARPLLLHGARTQDTASSHVSTQGNVTVEENASRSALDDANALEPAVDDTNTLGPAVDDTNTLGPAIDDTKAQGPAVVDANTLGSAVDDANAQGPAVDDTKAQGPAVDDTHAQGPAVDDANAQGPAVDDVQIQGPTVGDAGSQESAVGDVKTQGCTTDDTKANESVVDGVQAQKTNGNDSGSETDIFHDTEKVPDTDDVLAGPYSTDVQRVLRGRRLVSGPDDQDP